MLWTFCWHLQTPAATRSLRLEASYGSYTRNFTSHTFTLSSSTTPAIATAMCGQSLASCFILDESEFNLNHSLYIGFLLNLLSLFRPLFVLARGDSWVWNLRVIPPLPGAGPGTVTPLAPAPWLCCGRCWQPGPSLRWPASRHGETVNTRAV